MSSKREFFKQSKFVQRIVRQHEPREKEGGFYHSAVSTIGSGYLEGRVLDIRIF